jgi:Domain of unknown function (DUF4112)
MADVSRGRSAAPAVATTDPALAAAKKIARVMDGYHLDPVLGFVAPWAGDLLGAGLGLYPLLLAWRRGAPKGLLARMLLNLSVDLVTGAVPVVGDIWDFFFRAHRRNLNLLESRMTGDVVKSSPRDGLVVLGAVLVFLCALAVPIVLLITAIAALTR